MTDPARVAWLAERRSGVGASDVAAIMGRSPWASPYSIWADKVGLVPLDADDGATRDQELGRHLEPLVAQWFEEDTGLVVAGEQTVVRRPGTPWFATVDGFVVEAERCSIADALGVFEAKKTDDRLDEWEAGPPEHYVIQANWAMYCAGLGHAWLAALHLAFGHPVLRIYELGADLDLQRDAVAAVEEFWGYVERREPPPADAHRATTAALGEVYSDPDDGAVELGPDLADVVVELRDLKARREILDEAVAERENTLRQALGEHPNGRVGGRLAVSWRPQTAQRIDTKAVRRDHGAAYDRASTTRVLRLHGSER